jgi:hypothetical protein
VFRSPVVHVGGAVLAAGIIAACGSSPTSSTPAAPVSVASVSVAGTAPAVGATAQFTATATLSNGTTQSVTSQAGWQSSNTAVATVSNAGLVTAVSGGSADITATYQNVTGRLSTTIGKPATQTFALSGTVTDGTSGGVLPNIDVQATDSTGKTQSTRTGSTGTYTIAGVAAGTVSVGVAAVSYESTTLSVALTSDQRVDIVLKRVTCTFLVSPTTFSFTSAPAQGTVTIKSQAAGCTWTATSNDAFLTIASGGSGVDNAAITFSVAPNPIYLSGLAPRSGTLTIAGTTVTVRQDGPRLNTGVYDSALNALVCQNVGEGCSSGGNFSACPAGSKTESILYFFVYTPDGSPLAAGKPINIFIFADYTPPTFQIAADAQRRAWSPVDIFRGSNKGYFGSTVVPSGGLPVVRASLGNVTTVGGTGPCGSVDNLDLVFRVQ